MPKDPMDVGKHIPMKLFLSAMLIILLGGFTGIYFLYRMLYPPLTKDILLSAGPVTTEPVSLTLTVNAPDDNQLVFTPDLLIQGKTASNSLVLISTDSIDEMIVSNEKGDFSYTASLKEGANNLTISAFDYDGNAKSEERIVYYSKEKI